MTEERAVELGVGGLLSSRSAWSTEFRTAEAAQRNPVSKMKKEKERQREREKEGREERKREEREKEKKKGLLGPMGS